MEILPTFAIDRGEPYTRTITVSDSNGPIDFTGWSASGIVYDMNTDEEVINTSPTLDSLGNVVITFPDTESMFPSNLMKPTYQYIFELKLITDSGILSRIMKARVKVSG